MDQPIFASGTGYFCLTIGKMTGEILYRLIYVFKGFCLLLLVAFWQRDGGGR